MLTKKLIAGLAATAVVAGTLAASTAIASAHSPDTVYRPGNTRDFDSRDRFNEIWNMLESALVRPSFFDFGKHKDCEPVYARKWVSGPMGWTLKTVEIDETCDWRPYGFRPDW